MHIAEQNVVGLIRTQHGLISRSQALEAGLSNSTVARRLASGTWVRVGGGLYRHAAVLGSWRSRVLGACLRLNGYASHRAAAALWDLDGAVAGVADVVVGPTQATASSGVTVHRSTQFDCILPVERSAIPTTPVDRTLLDLGGVVIWGRFEAAVDDALRRSLIDWPALLSAYRRLGRRGRNGSAAMRRLLDERFGDDRVPLSSWNRLFAAILVNAGLPEPTLEYGVHAHDGRFVAQVDLAYPEARLGIELQSVKYHLSREAFERDAVRAAELAAAGWTWMPVTWRRQQKAAPQAVAAIRSVLRRHRD